VYYLKPVTALNICGAALLLVVTAGFMLNAKNKFAVICMGWIVYSFIILCIIGWGSSENGLILYSLYFSWAFLSLACLTIEKIFQKIPLIKYILYSAIIAVFTFINISGIYELIRFGVTYYPYAG
jgi:hypothetical protein